jgi:hypothetical protein
VLDYFGVKPLGSNPSGFSFFYPIPMLGIDEALEIMLSLTPVVEPEQLHRPVMGRVFARTPG